MSFYWKTRTLLSGDYREIERNMIAYHNEKVIKKYKGKSDIYCVIRLFSDEGGLFCLFFKAIAGISYALQNDYIPVIDMQTKENIFISKADRKHVNAWEYFFEQPAGVSFQQIKDKPNKIILENPMGPADIFRLEAVPEHVEYWRTLCRKHIHYSESVKELISQYKDMFQQNDKVLGVLARGTDYLNPGVGHPVQPDSREVISRAQELMKQYHCNKIFVATEDETILKQMKNEFGNKLMYVEQKRYQGVQSDKLGHLSDYKQDAVSMNQAYLTAMHCLAQCDCFFGGLTTGTVGVFLLSAGFVKFEYWYKGTHGESDAKTLDIHKL